MRGLRFSRSRSSLLKGTWCVLGDQQAGSLWQDGVISSSLSSRMIAAATTSFPSSLHLFGLPVSSRISSCSGVRRQTAPFFNVAAQDDLGKEPSATQPATASSKAPTTSRKRGLADIDTDSAIDVQDSACSCRPSQEHGCRNLCHPYAAQEGCLDQTSPASP